MQYSASRTRLPLLVIAALGLMCATIISSACGQSGTSDGPSGVVSEFYERLAEYDTAGVTALVCPEIREEVESGLSLLGALLGLVNVTRLGAAEMSLEDFSTRTIEESSEHATVQVNGRFSFGPPYGSTELDETVDLRREDGGWCMTDASVPSAQ